MECNNILVWYPLQVSILSLSAKHFGKTENTTVKLKAQQSRAGVIHWDRKEKNEEMKGFAVEACGWTPGGGGGHNGELISLTTSPAEIWIIKTQRLSGPSISKNRVRLKYGVVREMVEVNYSKLKSNHIVMGFVLVKLTAFKDWCHFLRREKVRINY